MKRFDRILLVVAAATAMCLAALHLGCLGNEREVAGPYGHNPPAHAATLERGSVYVLQRDCRLRLPVGGQDDAYPCPPLLGPFGAAAADGAVIVQAGTRIRFEGHFVHQQPWSGEGGSCFAGRLLDGPHAGTRVDLGDLCLNMPGVDGFYRSMEWLK